MKPVNNIIIHLTKSVYPYLYQLHKPTLTDTSCLNQLRYLIRQVVYLLNTFHRISLHVRILADLKY